MHQFPLLRRGLWRRAMGTLCGTTQVAKASPFILRAAHCSASKATPGFTSSNPRLGHAPGKAQVGLWKQRGSHRSLPSSNKPLFQHVSGLRSLVLSSAALL